MAGTVDALLLDLGGVVIDIDFGRAFTRWAEHSGGDAAVIAARFEADLPYRQHETGVLAGTDYFDHLRQRLGLDLSDDDMLDGWNAIFVGAMPGVAALLDRAATRLPLYAFSNSNAVHERYWAMHFENLLAPFTEVFVSSTIGLRKPEAESYAHVVAKIGRPAERIQFFDDHAENVTAARNCGLQAVQVTDRETLSETLSQLGI